MSGRFFKHLSDTESESEESEEEALASRVPVQPNYSFSDDEEEVKRVVRSAKEKHYEELSNTIKLIRNHKKIKDIAKLLGGFEDLIKSYQKARFSVIDKEEGGKVPKFYLKCLVELEDFVNDSWQDRKNMNKNNSKSLTTLRQKLRKYNKDFEAQINEYRLNPDIEDDDDEKESSDESEINESSGQPEAGAKGAEEETGRSKTLSVTSKDGGSEDDDDDDDIDWDMSSSSDESSSDDEDYGENLLAKFLKKDVDKDKEVKRREKKVKEIRKKKDDDGEWTKVEGVGLQEKPKMFAKDAEINHQVIVKKLLEIMAIRGKKKVDRMDQIEMLNELLSISKQNNFGPALEIKILLGLQSALAEYGSGSSMKHEIWMKYLTNMECLIKILEKNPDIIVQESIQEEQESFQTPPFKIQGCIVTMMEKLNEEFVRLLQFCDPHSPDYIEKLRDETRLIELITKVRHYLEKENRSTPSGLCRIYLLSIDLIYYKFDPRIMENQAKDREHPKLIILDCDDKIDSISDESADLNSMQLIDRLCKYIYVSDETGRICKLAALCQIYHFALHDHWYQARDLMIMTGLPSTILNHKPDIQLQILYNRALVQLGLCAFRFGFIFEAHSSLLDILFKGRVRELLGQGFNIKTVERSPEQAKLEKRCQIPFHKHINLDLIECVYLVSSMLLEIPEVASNEFSVRKKLISRSFFNQLRKNEEQPLVGVPEAMREHVVSASKAMRVGNWKQCQDYIINDKMNARVWNFFYNSEKVLKMLSQKIREESLRTYLFTYSFVYDSISIDTLANMFDLEANMVHSIISKMIINEELMASMDEPTRTVVMHRTEPSRIQSLALQLADKVNTLLDYNERLWELKLTPLGHFNQGARFDRGFQNRQGNRQNRQNRQNFGDRQHYRKQGNRNQGQRDRDREQQQAHQQSQQ
ncbi:hypothetical protein NH340_JMT00753 [Sarcoptes scabiei]|nr:hypothetical protein NH340_JMT00753 [Sarcoptes scabiei]